MVTVTDTTLTAAIIGPRIGNPGEPEATRILALAAGEVADAFANAWRDVPADVVDECVYRAARAIKDATNRNANGGGQVTVNDPALIRAPADPLASAWPLIRRYVVVGL